MLYGLKESIPEEEYLVPIGVGKVVQEGKDVTLISYSRMMLFCKEAAKTIASRGVKVELIDLRTVKPLDIGLIAHSVRKTGRVVVVEEGHRFSGIAAEVISQIQEHCFDFLDAPIERVCQMETPLPYSPPLEMETIPNVKRILKALEKVTEGVYS